MLIYLFIENDRMRRRGKRAKITPSCRRYRQFGVWRGSVIRPIVRLISYLALALALTLHPDILIAPLFEMLSLFIEA